jgi:hypothetical protein
MNFDQYVARVYIRQARAFRLRGDAHNVRFAIWLQERAMVYRCRSRRALPRQAEMFPAVEQRDEQVAA